MNQADEAGAIAAAEHFLALSAYTLQAGDVEAWRDVVSQDCRYCEYVLETVEAAQSRGSSLVGGDIAANSSRLVATDSTLGVFAVSVTYEASALTEVASDGGESTIAPAGSGSLTLEVVPTAGGWRLLGLVSEATP